MNILKIIGITLIITAALITNISYIRQVKAKTEALSQIVLMIDYIEISIKYQNVDVKSIFNSIKQSEKYNRLIFIEDFCCKNNEVLLTEYNFYSPKIRKTFSKHSCELLKGFFSMLGKSDVDGQILNCQTYKQFFKEELFEAENLEEKNIKTGSSLILGITFIFLIIIF